MYLGRIAVAIVGARVRFGGGSNEIERTRAGGRRARAVAPEASGCEGRACAAHAAREEFWRAASAPSVWDRARRRGRRRRRRQTRGRWRRRTARAPAGDVREEVDGRAVGVLRAERDRRARDRLDRRGPRELLRHVGSVRMCGWVSSNDDGEHVKGITENAIFQI